MKLKLKQLLSKIINTPLVVETGTEGIWYYRKWSDGTAECWGIDTRTYAAGETVVTLNLPFTLADTNYVWLGCVSDPMIGGSTAAYGTGVGCHIRTTTSFSFRYKTITGSSNLPVYMHVIGRWAEVDPTTSNWNITGLSQNQMSKAEIRQLIEDSGNEFKELDASEDIWIPSDLQ